MFMGKEFQCTAGRNFEDINKKRVPSKSLLPCTDFAVRFIF